MTADSSNPPEIVIRNDEGQALVRVELILTLYFDKGFDSNVRERIGHCFDEYFTRFESSLKWVALPGSRNWRRVDRERADAIHEWLRDGKARTTWFTAWRGGRNAHEASDYQFNVLGDSQPLPMLSYLSLAVPKGQLNGPGDSFVSMCVRMCKLLQPYHGYGGYGFAEPGDVGPGDEAQPLICSMSRRFPGIEVDRPVDHKFYVGAGIKGVNWLTVLGQPWLERMGGLAALRQALGPEFKFHEYDGGLVIQAGPRPQAGDVNQKIWPSLYAELSRVLRPIRITKHNNFDNRGENRFTREKSEAWLARFDREPWADSTAGVEGATVVEAGVLRREGYVPTTAWAPESALGATGSVRGAQFVRPGPIPTQLGVSFGPRCRIEGAPETQLVDAEVEVTHPPLTNPATGATSTVDRWDWRVPIGVPSTRGGPSTSRGKPRRVRGRCGSYSRGVCWPSTRSTCLQCEQFCFPAFEPAFP